MRLDGEAVVTGPDIEVAFVSPLAPGRAQEIDDIRGSNEAGGATGRRVWWVASTPDHLEERCKRYEALVKVTGDRRFTEDSSADTQDALSEKRKERDELRGALSDDLEGAFRNGTLFYGGQELELDDAVDLKGPLTVALTSIIPNLYPRFGLADRSFDFAKDLKALLNPSTSTLHTVAAGLDLFDTQGTLQRESGLVSQVLEVIGDLEDEGVDPTGSLLIDARDSSGFKGFERPPFGWPGEIVRLVLAACFRAGAIYLERQTSTGPSPIYDYTGRTDDFAKVTVFKKTTFRVAETSLSVEQIRQASQALIALGVTGTPESGNAIAAALRKLGAKLHSGIEDARQRSQQGLPAHEALLSSEAALREPTTAKDPTVAVVAFLAVADTWKDVDERLGALQRFLEGNRHQAFAVSRRLVELIANHPAPETHPNARVIAQALEDMDAIVQDKAVVERWADYQKASDHACRAYREIYRRAYDEIRQEVEGAVAAIRGEEAYAQAPEEHRDPVVGAVFGPGRVCHYAQVDVGSTAQLIEAAERRSLTSLGQARVALPGYCAQVEAELRKLAAPPPKPDEKVFEWRTDHDLTGRRFATEQEVDEAFAQATKKLQRSAEALKARIREGFTVVVK